MAFFEYFRVYYLQLARGYIFVVSNYIIAAMIPVLLCSYSLKKWKSLAALLGKMVLSCALMELIGAIQYDYTGSADTLPYIGGIFLLIGFAVFSKRLDIRSRFATAAAYAGVYALALSLSMGIGLISGVEDFVLQKFLTLLNAILLICLTLLFRRMSRTGIPNRTTATVLSLSGILGYLFGSQGRHLELPSLVNLTVTLMMLLLLIAVSYALFSVSGWIQMRNRQQAEKLLRQADENMLRVLTDQLETYQRIRHDMRNHILVMQTLLEQGEYEKLRSYFAEYSGQLVPAFSAITCPHRAIMAVLNMEQTKAQYSGITLETSIAVPQEMGFADTDLSSLLMNLIDNAIEYLEKTPSLSQPVIRVEIRLIHRSLVISVQNPLLEKDTAFAMGLRTAKRDKDIHGYGTKIVESITHAYNGAVRYQVKGGFFEASVIITEPEGGDAP
ncbi:MAG: sensor histidine kinase [Faecousia sp.]